MMKLYSFKTIICLLLPFIMPMAFSTEASAKLLQPQTTHRLWVASDGELSEKGEEVSFSSLDYVNSGQGRYLYRLSGFEDEWKELPTGRHSVSYTNLSPGGYTLEVKYVALGETVEDAPVSEFHLKVVPYYYKRWWFLLLVLVALVGCVWLIYRWRVRDLTRQLNSLKEAVDERVHEINEQKDLIERNVDEYLLKPFDEDILIVRIENILDNRRRYQERFKDTMEVDKLGIEEETGDKKFVDRVMEVVRANYQNSYFEVGDFAEALGVSRSMLNKKLTSLLGESPNQFMRTYRLKIAHELLIKNRASKAMNVSEIAFEVGFNDSKYFTRCFTKQYGMSPSSLLKTK